MQDLTIIPASNAALPDVPMRLKHWIGGAWVDSADGATSERFSPAHGVPVSVAAKGGQIEAEAGIAAARAIGADFDQIGHAPRGGPLRRTRQAAQKTLRSTSVSCFAGATIRCTRKPQNAPAAPPITIQKPFSTARLAGIANCVRAVQRQHNLSPGFRGQSPGPSDFCRMN